VGIESIQSIFDPKRDCMLNQLAIDSVTDSLLPSTLMRENSFATPHTYNMDSNDGAETSLSSDALFEIILFCLPRIYGLDL
jgi:hypothetical protein